LAEQASEAAAIPTQYHFLFLLLLFLVPPLFPHTKSTQTTPLKSTQTTPELQRLKKKKNNSSPKSNTTTTTTTKSNTHVSETCRREEEEEEEDEGWDRVLSFGADVGLLCT
jgi:hypothetical protein